MNSHKIKHFFFFPAMCTDEHTIDCSLFCKLQFSRSFGFNYAPMRVNCMHSTTQSIDYIYIYIE